jgi:membrane protein DedA with SNARE-associated domain
MDIIASALRLLDLGSPWVAQYGLLIGAAAVFGQAIPGVTLVLPGFAISLALGAFCAAGTLNFTHVLAAAWLGGVLGLLFTFQLGRRLGTVAHRSRFQIRERVLAALRSDPALPLYYVYATPVRQTLPYLAGSMGYPFPRWVGYNLLGVLPWVACQLAIGYVAGAAIESGNPVYLSAGFVVLFGTALAATSLVLRRVNSFAAEDKADADAPQTEAEGASGP